MKLTETKSYCCYLIQLFIVMFLFAFEWSYEKGKYIAHFICLFTCEAFQTPAALQCYKCEGSTCSPTTEICSADQDHCQTITGEIKKLKTVLQCVTHRLTEAHFRLIFVWIMKCLIRWGWNITAYFCAI